MKIDLDNMIKLSAVVSDDEVRQAIFSVTPLKAPRVDGIRAKFYETHWDIVSPCVCKMVKDVFSRELLDPALNRTLMVLIPKCNDVNTISQYRSISLCTIAYKIITKTIVIRLQKIMQVLVRQNQSRFIASRNISDNIIIA